MTTALFDLADFEETRIDWVSLYKPFGITLASLIVPSRCRDCGVKVDHVTAESSRPGVGVYVVCDGCQPLDGALPAGDDFVSHWGIRTTTDAHEHLINEQHRRRDAYQRRKGGRR